MNDDYRASARTQLTLTAPKVAVSAYTVFACTMGMTHSKRYLRRICRHRYRKAKDEGNAALEYRNRRRADAGPPQLRGSELRGYLDRLINQLDGSSLRAALKLMIWEARGAIHRQASLIALERLAGRNTATRMDWLRELKDVENELATVYVSRIEARDDFGLDESETANEPTRPEAIHMATKPPLCSFRGFVMKPPHERRVNVESVSVVSVRSRPVSTQPPLGHRQGRHGARSPR
ncbi:hypothetical protein [Reyranella soli]|uniref:hypothetical protein n=1 Tax=Reyranella soli TaxID=1230389 RepID=UPI0011BEC93F|nr:hypothetical protein [Reyranella soli]